MRQVSRQQILDIVGVEAGSQLSLAQLVRELDPLRHQPRLELLGLGRRVHRAIGLVPHALIEVGERLRCEPGRRRGQRRVDAYAVIVDLGIEHPRILLRRRQGLQLGMLMQLAFDRDVLPVVDIQLGAQLRRIDPIDLGGVFIAPWLARLPHDANDLFPGDVLLVHQTENFGDALEAAGIGVRERQRHRADVPIDRHHRPAMPRDQNAFEHCPFERRVVRDPGAVRVRGGRQHHLGDRLSGDPGLDRAVAAGVADAEHSRSSDARRRRGRRRHVFRFPALRRCGSRYPSRMAHLFGAALARGRGGLHHDRGAVSTTIAGVVSTTIRGSGLRHDAAKYSKTRVMKSRMLIGLAFR